jgi:hypothetical protein
LGALLSLAMADDPGRARELSRRPPRLAPGAAARVLTHSLNVGVIGELSVMGGQMPDLVLARGPDGGWDLGASHKRNR